MTNLGGGSANSLVYLNGNSAPLPFGNQAAQTDSAEQTAIVTNIGNQTLTLHSNFYTATNLADCAIAESDTCAGGDALTATSPSCAFSLQFDPAKAGAASTTITVQSNAYNPGKPLINLTGVGTPKSKGMVNAGVSQTQTKKAGRKSFAASR